MFLKKTVLSNQRDKKSFLDFVLTNLCLVKMILRFAECKRFSLGLRVDSVDISCHLWSVS